VKKKVMPLSSMQIVISARNTRVRYRKRQKGHGSTSEPMRYVGTREEGGERTAKERNENKNVRRRKMLRN
jgi:hypothetical protein